MTPTANSKLRAAICLISSGLVMLSVACRREEPVPAGPRLAGQLESMRAGLSAYAKKHGRYPGSLEEMVASGVLAEIPTDPVTGSNRTWKLVREESVAVNEFSTDVPAAPESAPIVDIRSGAGGTDPSGVPWSEY